MEERHRASKRLLNEEHEQHRQVLIAEAQQLELARRQESFALKQRDDALRTCEHQCQAQEASASNSLHEMSAQMKTLEQAAQARLKKESDAHAHTVKRLREEGVAYGQFQDERIKNAEVHLRAEAEAMQRNIDEQNSERVAQQQAMDQMAQMQRHQFNDMVQQLKQHEVRERERLLTEHQTSVLEIINMKQEVEKREYSAAIKAEVAQDRAKEQDRVFQELRAEAQRQYELAQQARTDAAAAQKWAARQSAQAQVVMTQQIGNAQQCWYG